jgi:hypothetical protein
MYNQIHAAAHELRMPGKGLPKRVSIWVTVRNTLRVMGFFL